MNYHRYKSRDPNLTRERQFWEKLRRYFPRFYRLDLKSEPYSELRELLDGAELTIQEIKRKMVIQNQLQIEVDKVKAKKKLLEEEKSILSFNQDQARGLVGAVYLLFGHSTQKEKCWDAKVDKVQEAIGALFDQEMNLHREMLQLQYLSSNLELFEWYKNKIEPIARRRKDTEDAWNELRNRAAQNSTQIRDAAHIIKDRIKAQHCCPYCGGDLGESPHADHIYPVSKGGRSTERNMVYVCARCNKDKSDLTLSAFIRHNDLDRDAIEARLSRMGKDF